MAKKHKTWIIVDEFGDTGISEKKKKTRGRSTTYGFGVSVVNNLKAFGDISSDYATSHKITHELKGRKIPQSDKLKLAEKIEKNTSKTYGFYIDKTKKDTPTKYKLKEKCIVPQQNIFKKALSDVVKPSMGQVIVYADRNTIYQTNSKTKNPKSKWDEGYRIIDEVSKKKKTPIKAKFISSLNETIKGDAIRTNDIVNSCIRDHTEHGKKECTRIMGTKVKRLKK